MSEFYLLGNTTPSQMFGCVIKTKNKTVVIDGGTYKDSGQLVDLLRRKSDLHVNAWFFTHPHHDHIGCFVDIRKNHPEVIIDKLYYHFPNLTGTDPLFRPRSEMEIMLWQDVQSWDLEHDTHKIRPGEIFEFDEVNIRILRVFEPTISSNCTNNSSAVYRIEGDQSSILILGDIGIEGGQDVLNKCPVELLYADYTQMAHHGQGGVSKEFYQQIKPKRCLWPTPGWLWDNDMGNGFDTAQYVTVRTREWMDELGVIEHFIEKDGTQKIEI